ncbi:hypothetical protein [Actinopolyspora mortivallis]|uniref:Uncharacterized protein n=1 Tax=Actinopolyspora mortivallis TaxID=33906 RepID=A0A2T0GRF2_ACTMO|nr:hypothetical protein [Actinopolyspora mortivallis]PRW61688.1 hypothetical protein CEP50_19420 [Actinopolyspora mortivallis]
MSERLPTTWRERGLHWHAFVTTTVTTSSRRRHHPLQAVALTPQDGAAWLTETLTSYQQQARTVRWTTPLPQGLRPPECSCPATAALAAGYPVEAVVLTPEEQFHLHLDPLTPLQCPHHQPQTHTA